MDPVKFYNSHSLVTLRNLIALWYGPVSFCHRWRSIRPWQWMIRMLILIQELYRILLSRDKSSHKSFAGFTALAKVCGLRVLLDMHPLETKGYSVIQLTYYNYCEYFAWPFKLILVETINCTKAMIMLGIIANITISLLFYFLWHLGVVKGIIR